MEFTNKPMIQVTEECLTNLTTNAQCNYNGNLKEIIYNNFMLEIGKYLLKNEKINLRQVSKHYAFNVFPLFSISLNVKNKHDIDNYLPKKIKFSKIFNNFCYVEKLNLENIYVEKEMLTGLDLIFNNNFNRIKILSLVNLEYQGMIAIGELEKLLDNLTNLEELKIANIGNRDKLFINTERNFINLKMFSQVKTLKIDNIPLKQIIYLINAFENLENLCIENCSLDEDLAQVEQNLNKKGRKALNLKSLNLSQNGLSSQTAMESLKKILINQKNLECLILRGLWFQEIYPLNEEFKVLEKLNFLDFTGSKNIFNGVNSITCLSFLKNIRILNLDDCRMDDEDLLKLLHKFKAKNYTNLEELNLIRCLLTDDSIKNILDYSESLENLRVLNFNFNHRITEKGFNLFLDNFSKLKSLNVLNLRNTGISLKYSIKSLCNFIVNFSKLKKINYNYSEIENEINNNDHEFLKIENLSNKPIFVNHFSEDYTINELLTMDGIFNMNNLRNSISSEEEILLNDVLNENSPKKIQKKINTDYQGNKTIYYGKEKPHVEKFGNLEILELYFCTLYDNDYYSLIEEILKTLKVNNINQYLNLRIGLKIFNNKKPIFKKVESLQSELYKKYNLIIR